MSLQLLITAVLLAATIPTIHREDLRNNNNCNDGNYALTSSAHKSLLIAAGCFWCAEQAYKQYTLGVIEVVSGYAGSNGIDSPTYINHPRHYE
eukprot:2037117-Ditylum_brightwellii.AAC.1